MTRKHERRHKHFSRLMKKAKQANDADELKLTLTALAVMTERVLDCLPLCQHKILGLMRVASVYRLSFGCWDHALKLEYDAEEMILRLKADQKDQGHGKQ